MGGGQKMIGQLTVLSWKQLCESKSQGRLGVTQLHRMNGALLA